MIKVAVVEDDRDVRSIMENLINNSPGLRCVCTCATGEEALKRIPTLEVDVVLMDINLPNLSGVECTGRLKEILPKVPILMLTVYTDVEVVFKALQVGAQGYLLKRTAPSKLVEAIHDVLQGGSPMTGEIARKVVDSFRKPEPGGRQELDLTPREREVLELLAMGYTNKEIGSRLNLGATTIHTHLGRIYEKLQVRTRAGAVARFLKTTSLEQPNVSPS